MNKLNINPDKREMLLATWKGRSRNRNGASAERDYTPLRNTGAYFGGAPGLISEPGCPGFDGGTSCDHFLRDLI